MNPKMIKLLGLSALTAGILAAASGARADETKAPSFTAEPCCNLCPEAHDAKNYTTRYQQNFTTLVQAQGDWLFRTQEDLRTEFNTTPAGYKRLQQLHDAFKAKRRRTGARLPANPGPGEPQQAQPTGKRPLSTTRKP
nr:hypothetical protein GCM10020185_49880 [Pseudomonas brassicacearum subsp. brassicacearum]